MLFLISNASLGRLLFLTVGPMVGLLLWVLIESYFSKGEFSLPSGVVPIHFVLFAFQALTQGHVFLIFHRTFFNREVFTRYRSRIILGTTLVFLGALLNWWIFLLIALLNVFWLQYHFMRQHFGVSRMLGKKEYFSNIWLRRADLFFISLTFFVPPFLSRPDFLFSPGGINKILIAIGCGAAISPLMTLFETLVSIAFLVQVPAIMFSTAYLYYLWRYEGREKALFSTSLFAVFWSSWVLLSPEWGIGASIATHSLQYYYLVSKNRENPKSGMSMALFLAFVFFAFCFGTLHLLFAEPDQIEASLFFEGRWLMAFVASVNILHFWMDGFAWKQPRRPAATEVT